MLAMGDEPAEAGPEDVGDAGRVGTMMSSFNDRSRGSLLVPVFLESNLTY